MAMSKTDPLDLRSHAVSGDWVIEWIADEHGDVLHIEGNRCTASYRWVFRERIWTPDEVAAGVDS